MSPNRIPFSGRNYDKLQDFLSENNGIPQVIEDSLRISHIGFWEWNDKEKTFYWSSEVYRILDLDPYADRPSMELYISLIPKKDRHFFESKIKEAAGTPVITIEHAITLPNGEERRIKVCGEWYMCPTTNHTCCGGTIQDVTTLERLPLLEDFPMEVFDSNLVGIVITDSDGGILFANQAFSTITGYDKNTVLGRNPRILKSDRQDHEFYKNMWNQLIAAGKWEGEIWNRRKNGEIYPEWLTIRAVRDKNGTILRFMSHFVDLSELRHKDAQLARYSYLDVLTGSGNKEMFFINLDKEIKEAEEEHSRFAVLALDINRFKSVNESLGYVAGDKLLQLAATRIRDELGKRDFLARFSGDNFYILLHGFKDRVSLSEKIAKLIEEFKRPFSIAHKGYFLSVGIGISIYPDNATTRDELIGQSEQALQRSQKAGTNYYAFFSDSPLGKNIDYLAVESQLQSALEDPDREFRVKFQPKLWLSTNEVDSFEALVRWEHPEKGLLPPLEFVHIAEETGLIIPIDMWVFKEACRLSVEWEKLLGKRVKIAVNFSSKQYYRKDLLSKLRGMLDITGADPGNIGIEITETGIMTDFGEAAAILSDLKKMGFTLFIDDFGTGYSSLAYLREFPVDALKIDKSFIDNILTAPQTAVLVKTIITMAHSLNMTVIAEGVETPEQQAFLIENDCDLIQGYIVSPPIDSGAVIDFMKSRKGHPQSQE